jgi:hypothetical protein
MTTLNSAAFRYLKPTDRQLNTMDRVRTAAALYASVLDDMLPDGPDKTYTLRKLREVAMWANVAISRNADGSPRIDPEDTDA